MMMYEAVLTFETVRVKTYSVLQTKWKIMAAVVLLSGGWEKYGWNPTMC